MFIFKSFFFFLVYLSKQSNFTIILNATGTCALKKVDNLIWSMTCSYFFILFYFFGENDIISNVNLKHAFYKFTSLLSCV